MKMVGELQVIPIGVGSKEVMQAHEIIKKSGLKAELHAYGTNVEGDLDTLFAAVKNIHATLHQEGVPRIATFIKIGTRTDKEPTLADKLPPA